MDKITLEQLLQYCNTACEPADRIQIVSRWKEWDDVDEVSVDSDLLTPFLRWIVWDMSCERSLGDGKPLFRVLLKPARQ